MSSGSRESTPTDQKGGRTAASLTDRNAWLREEIAAINERGDHPPGLLRHGTGSPLPSDTEGSPPPKADPALAGQPNARSYAGLALSGGGIRSASLCLGVLQALNAAKLLPNFGWLSTVSGGGYTGLGWLAHAATSDKTFPFHPPEANDRPMRTLRDRASYLKAPGFWPGMVIAGMLLRKLLANLALLAPLVLILGAAMGLLHAARSTLPKDSFEWLSWASLALLVVLAFLASWALNREGRIGAEARVGSDDIAAKVLLGLIIVAALLALSYMPDWARTLIPLFKRIIPQFIQDGGASKFMSLFSGIAGLLGAGALASRMKGRFATLGLSIIGVLFLLALLAVAVVIVHRVEDALACCDLAMVKDDRSAQLSHILIAAGIFLLLGVAGGMILTGVAWIIDANALSMHGYYRDRLMDAFFPATTQTTTPIPPRLSNLLPVRTGGPLPVVNATVAGTNDAGMSRRGRPAGPFTLTPLQAGSDYLDYAPTSVLEGSQRECDAATAMALSAAAVAPQAGRVTGGRVAVFFKALLNARTGRWMPAPKILNKEPRVPIPPPDGWYALREMFGSFRALSDRPVVLVSDGGHWENLGILSLVHRHCPLILAVDAEADPEMGFNGLGIATMLSRLDAGTEVRVAVDDLKRGQNGLSAAHCRIGTLEYLDGGLGTLIYVKSTLTGDEPPDVLTYAAAHPAFPHETTADQFFSEAQFEAYRALGEHIGLEVAAMLSVELNKLR